MESKIFPTFCLTGLIAVVLGGCGQWSQEKKINWMVGKFQKELRLKKDQGSHLLALKEELILAEKIMAKRRKPERFDQFFKPEGFDRQEALSHFDSKFNEYRDVLSKVAGRVEIFYNSLDENQRSNLVRLISDHEYPIHGKGIFRERVNHGKS